LSSTLALVDVERAWQARDPQLASLVVSLADSWDSRPDGPVREGAVTWWTFRSHLTSRAFRKKTPEERQAWRTATLARLEADDAEVPLPDRLWLHEVILALWEDDGPFARRQLLEIIARVPLKWGPWRALKRIFKEAEQRPDDEVWGALAARFDHALARRRSGEVKRATLRYLVRRAWRRLRDLGRTMPVAYPDAAVEVLRHYPDSTDFGGTWIANHVLMHDKGGYGRGSFSWSGRLRRNSDLLKHRAFADSWRRTPRPLLTLLETARAELPRRYATQALKSDFRTRLRDVEPGWIARLVAVGSESVDDFAVWLLQTVPRFEQGAFRELGLHEPVLALLDSDSEDAAAWAADYARTHARDLALDELIRHANNDCDAVRKMARDLLRERDPRTEVGLEAWGRLLGTEYGHKEAVKVLRASFGARELTADWFIERLVGDNDDVVEFAIELLPKLHDLKKLGVPFLGRLLDHPDLDWTACRWALDALERIGPASVEPDFLRRALLSPNGGHRVRGWVDEGTVGADALGVDFLKVVAFHVAFEADPWIGSLKASDRPWAKELEFDADLSEWVLGLLGDVRRFTPDQVGFEWSMELVQRPEPRYHDFASALMAKAFLPADFADGGGAAEPEPEPTGEITVDLELQTFLFTGKLSTMTRSEAKKKVTAAGGKNASGVNGKLDWLVIGDEGSPLYGAGRKGSKQVKAERLIADGAPMRIISETAFLQMLSGEQRSFDEGATEAGCQRLWSLAVDPGPADAPLARFARHYLRMHHPDIALAETDRPVDPGAEIPDDFLSFERCAPLLGDDRAPVRAWGMELLRWELARWSPPMHEIVALCELPHAEVRDFLFEAMTADDSPRHRRYRLDPSVLTADAVYRFCESTAPATRQLGIELIERNPRLALPEELFRLTESPDRRVRAFAIRRLWSLYRERGITPRTGPPRPDGRPAGDEELGSFLRRSLFGIPPARLPKEPVAEADAERARRLRPLSAWRAKVALIELVRDLAAEDRAFATLVTPHLAEFGASRGRAEKAACLVALARIGEAWPDLDTLGEVL